MLDFAAQGNIHDERLWMPIAAASGAAGSTTCLVGTAEQVTESMLAYYDLGCSAFIIRGFDPLNDAREYGRELIPRLRDGVVNRAQVPINPLRQLLRRQSYPGRACVLLVGSEKALLGWR